jgi:hypothetical protein
MPGRTGRLWIIAGRSGHVFPDGAGFLLCVATQESPRRWTNVKDRLAGLCRVTQDGDDEGCLHLDRLPTPDEADRIRGALGIKRRRHLTPEALASIMARLSAPPTGSLSNGQAFV